ncbi:GlsB/YeaQ/YmgE family stress response membrane protein [Rhizobium glycinendophyticum]|uniref:GlsB/YeaQ/YmgE family stress response membrane protein n=1 Tax=Rhizobium glycinendophyticum TaxID=2589807 RepID=A0A504U971_9HYPH|nr:GlsB/YeaQ/YmgE family stress response membrane protein [Rhizobium glycinendophyticum]TPP11069.1 GlsB/YeaQ/YmgE family stress response membrane protein [Rhizobium glycinendophyticum]
MFEKDCAVAGFEVGIIATIFFGGLAGWLAGKLMDMRFGVFMNIIIGIIGAVIAAAIFRRFGVFVAGDWLGYLITSFVGASILLFIAKLVRR